MVITGSSDADDIQPLNDNQAILSLDLGSVGLIDLTSAVHNLCNKIEDQERQTIVFIMANKSNYTWPGDITIQDVNRWEQAVRRLENVGAITIALASGECGGSAFEIFLAADYRLVTPSFKFLLPVNEGQFWPGMGIFRLVHQIGVAKARQLVLWGHDLDCSQALTIGLIDEVTDEDLEFAARKAASRLGHQSSGEVSVRRRLLFDAYSMPFDEALGAHLAACDRELRRIINLTSSILKDANERF